MCRGLPNRAHGHRAQHHPHALDSLPRLARLDRHQERAPSGDSGLDGGRDRTFRYNHLEDVAAAFALDECRDIAAVMLEPTLTEAPASGFLEGLLELAHAHGALVIFDEMITGARWALGGAQEYFNVIPDLSTHGKSYANGFPLAFVCGRAELMQHAWPISGTFGGEVSASRPATRCSTRTARMLADPIARMWDVGQRLMDGVNGICARLNLPAKMIGYPCRPVLKWDFTAQANSPTVWNGHLLEPTIVALLQQELAQHGVLVHPSGWNPQRRMIQRRSNVHCRVVIARSPS